MVAPVDTTVTLTINAQDVAHSWWIPKLGGKFDAIPGYTNYTWFKIPGKLAGQTFTGQCAELCGRNHANMTAACGAVTPVAVRAVHPDAQDRAEGRQRRGRRVRASSSRHSRGRPNSMAATTEQPSPRPSPR